MLVPCGFPNMLANQQPLITGAYRMNRRRFLLGSLLATMTTAVIPEAAHGKPDGVTGRFDRDYGKPSSNVGLQHELYPDRLFEALVAVQKDQGIRWNDSLRPEQVDNLKYAVTKIEPKTHQEIAFVVAIGMSGQKLSYLVDEYVSRRNGGPVSLPDHSILALEGYCLPDTQRLPIYREQVNALFLELIDHAMSERKMLWQGMRVRKVSVSEFHEHLREPYHSRLTEVETIALYEAMHIFLNVGMRPYAWCSTITERAMQLVVSA